LNECDECIAEDGSSVPIDVLKAIATGCQAKGLIRPNELDIPNGVITSQLILGDYDQPTIEAIEDLCGRALSDFEHQEKLVNKIIQVRIDNFHRRVLHIPTKFSELIRLPLLFSRFARRLATGTMYPCCPKYVRHWTTTHSCWI